MALVAAASPAFAAVVCSSRTAPGAATVASPSLARLPAPRPAARRCLAAPRASADAQAFVCDASPTARRCGLTPVEVEQAFRLEHPGLLEALAGAAAGLTPAVAAATLRRLEAELPPVVGQLAPGGDSVLVAIVPGLLPLLQRAAACSEEALAAGQPQCAAATARAALRLLSRLDFSSRASAAPYAAAGVRCKQALKAAHDAGAPLSQEDAVDHYAACARASPWLWLTPYAGLSATAAVDGFIAGGWATGELAVRFAEAYATLAGDGRFAQVPATWTRLIRAALQHPLSADQVQRLLRAAHALPIDMRLSMDLHARSEPGDCWYAALQQRLAAQQRAAAAAAGAANCAVPARFTLSPAKQRV